MTDLADPRSSTSHAPVASSRDGLGQAGRALIYTILVAGTLLKGAAVPIPFLIVVILIAAVSILASLRWPRDRRVGLAVCAALGLGLALAGLAFAQSIVLTHPLFANPIWAETNPLLFVTGQAVSVAPTSTREAIPTLLGPFFLFAACLAFFPDNRRAMGLLRFLAALGGLFAAFGLVQVTLLPRSLLLFEKEHYIDSLTSVFVNRNTAGTFLGVASLVAAITFVDALRRRPGDLMPQGDGGLLGRTFPLRAALPLAGMALTVIALLLTKSRGAVLSSLLGYAVTVPWLVLIARPTVSASDDGADRHGWRRLLPAAGAMALLVVAATLFGGLTASRLGANSVDPGRLCLFRAATQAFHDHWRFGTGFATFQDVFPGYRSAGCAATGTAFIRAHNFYLEGLVGFGVLFVPAVLAGYALVVSIHLHGYRTRRRYRFVPVLGIGIVLVATAHGMVDFSLQIPGMSNYMAATLAAIATICLGRPRTGSSTPS